VQDSHLVAMED